MKIETEFVSLKVHHIGGMPVLVETCIEHGNGVSLGRCKFVCALDENRWSGLICKIKVEKLDEFLTEINHVISKYNVPLG